MHGGQRSRPGRLLQREQPKSLLSRPLPRLFTSHRIKCQCITYCTGFLKEAPLRGALSIPILAQQKVHLCCWQAHGVSRQSFCKFLMHRIARVSRVMTRHIQTARLYLECCSSQSEVSSPSHAPQQPRPGCQWQGWHSLCRRCHAGACRAGAACGAGQACKSVPLRPQGSALHTIGLHSPGKPCAGHECAAINDSSSAASAGLRCALPLATDACP